MRYKNENDKKKKYLVAKAKAVKPKQRRLLQKYYGDLEADNNDTNDVVPVTYDNQG